MQQERSVEKRKYLCTTIVWGTLARYLFEQRRDGFWKKNLTWHLSNLSRHISRSNCERSKSSFNFASTSFVLASSIAVLSYISWDQDISKCQNKYFKPEVRWSHLLTCCILLFVAHSEHWSFPGPWQAWDQKIIKIFKNNDGKISRSLESLGQNLVKMLKKRIRKLPVLVELSLV